ncbi:hypothetical protein ZYGR_0I05050 [Zygosaccharomyces rouxii]|uniref:ZYRO0C11968p n=2 Tax=Zygosaccharomyces rouxii TaxID=4956 RepID=C5DTX1_ZYGRC|nr:uncharacterized protein ZYRO0C11968g [Zygosaccharomyces rouxii]KAH9201593.1 protein phosphatase 2C 6 [Zygosaccharomyces rouxii]GAV48208.1 hypothetical protein ZYGR_0I05050 [Zygosaccharomyces rouxii]CAQ43532.1 Protein phosphatase 2C homolog 6 [Zygosaccharomyces rouxii]CAR27232.1 ZYRO0C11968p [Zygosaccharomyces rouxii]
MGRTQSFIHLKPANLQAGFGSTRRWKPVLPTRETDTTNDIDKKFYNDKTMLKVHLNKFPDLIGHSTSRINRLYNEDAYSINIMKLPSLAQKMEVRNNLNDLQRRFELSKDWKRSVLNLSVFDGHGNKGRVSKLLAENLHQYLVDVVPTRQEFDKLLQRYCQEIGGQYWQRIYDNRNDFYETFISNCQTKQELTGSRMIFDRWGNIIDKNSLLSESERLRIFYAYLKFDLDHCCGFASNNDEGNLSFEERCQTFSGGSTGSSMFISAYDESMSFEDAFFVDPAGLLKLVITQVGDTKIVLCDQNGIAHNLTKVHHASSTRETKRLENSNNIAKDSFGEARFLNNYANTRSFGDLPGKAEGLSCEPDIYSYLIGSKLQLPHSELSKMQFGGDECFICLITDGVSDLMSDQELTDLITSTVNLRGLKVATPQFVADQVIKYVMAVGGRQADNATCLVMRLPNWGNWPDVDRTGAQRESKLMAASQADRTDDF